MKGPSTKNKQNHTEEETRDDEEADIQVSIHTRPIFISQT